MPAGASRQVLIVAPAWIGDMVMAQALLIALRAADPDTAIDVLAPATTGELGARMPEVRNVIEQPVGHGEVRLGARWRLARALAATGYDRAIVLPNSLKSALIPLFAGIPRRTGWRGEHRYGLLNDLRVLDTGRYPLMVERFVALAGPPGAPLPEPVARPALSVDRNNVKALAKRFGLDKARPLLALCPGAEYGEAKRWPADHFAAVAAYAIGRSWQVAVLGGAHDRAVAKALHAALSPGERAGCVDLTGQTALVDAVDLLALADAVVSNDSGLMHVGAAVGTPLVAVYGSSSPDFTPPLGHDVRIVAEDLDCRPCFERRCPLGHLRCLRELAPARVIDALASLPAAAGVL